MAAELTCARRTTKIVEENSGQVLRKENKGKEKKTVLELISCPRRIRKA